VAGTRPPLRGSAGTLADRRNGTPSQGRALTRRAFTYPRNPSSQASFPLLRERRLRSVTRHPNPWAAMPPGRP
jgi:hypothetical protein